MNKVIFSDVDGTLVDHSFIISDEINHELDKLEDHFVIATGRMYETVKDININLNCDFIASNGSEVIVNNKHVFSQFMDKNVALNIIEQLLSEKKYINIYTTDGCYVPMFDGIEKIIMDEAHRYAKDFSSSLAEYPSNIQGHLNLFFLTNKNTYDIYQVLEGLDIIKLEIVDCLDIPKTVNYLEDKYFITAYSSFGHNLEIVPKNTTKVLGIEKYLNHLNLANSKTFAIGDGINDIEMLKYVDVAIAMGNAHPKLKAIADHVVDPIEQGGFLQALEIIKNSY